MTDFLQSLKADLLDRRFLPLVALLGVALVAALAYAVISGSGGPSASPAPPATSAASSAGPATPRGGVPVSQAPANPNEAVSETTSGASHQRSGAARNPFTPLPGSQPKTSSSASSAAAAKSAGGAGSSSSGQSGSGSGAGSSSQGSGGTTPVTHPKPAKPKPQPVYEVNVLFGVAPAGTPAASFQLTPYTSLKRLEPLTAGGESPLVFAGVVAGGHSAIFTLVRELILHGSASCHPSASQCQAIGLTPGQSEELEYTTPAGQALVYKLELVSIAVAKASASKAASIFRAESPAGRALLRRDGLSALPGLRYSLAHGVVVLPGQAAFGARVARARAAKARAARHR
jgi:hypothetical protein